MTTSLDTKRRTDLTRYDPDQGLKQIAVAEAAVKHFARAKDARKLEEAIRAKLQAQADFVSWWDTQANKAKPGQPKKYSVRSDGILRLGKNGLPEEIIVRRWRDKLGDEGRFEATLQDALARYVKILELDADVHVAQNSGNNEWYTPTEYIEAARAVLGEIDLNPASSAEANVVVKAKTFYTLKQEGHRQPWRGRVWLNPPYAQPAIEQFAEKLAASVIDRQVDAAVVLVNNATETAWFRTIADVAQGICFPEGRVKFWSPTRETATPLQGQAVLYIGDRLDVFRERFQAFGLVWRE